MSGDGRAGGRELASGGIERWRSAARSCEHIELRPGGREEYLPGISEDFPYLFVLSEHDRYQGGAVPWHWHQELEVFYVLEGPVEYATPNTSLTLPTGVVNANVLHMTRSTGDRPGGSLLIHEMRPSLIAAPGSRVWQRYVEPLTSATSAELVCAAPGDAGWETLRDAMERSLETTERREEGWELRLRNELSELWLGLFELARPRLAEGPARMPSARDERLRAMLDFVGEHYPERIGVRDVAAAAFASERECHRTFREALGVTPAQYLRDYRIEQACRMLAHTTRPVAAVAELSGLGSASHFGQAFRAAMGCTPSEYRGRWQDSDTDGQQTS